MATRTVSNFEKPVLADKPGRSRQWHSKVKSGCLTCKTRRVKCGEQKPSCSRCLSSGRTCSYGNPPKTKLFEIDLENRVSATALDLLMPRQNNISNPEEARALQYFLEVTAPAASTYNSHTRDFFAQLIPQVAQSDAAVRHLAVAVASRQESISSGSDNAQTLTRVQTKHYVAALKTLSRDKATSEEIVLLASALFLTLGQMETLEEQRAQSLFHLMSGLKIMIERLKDTQAKPSHIIETYLHPIFGRMEMMMSVFMLPASGIDGILCTIEPTEPFFPTYFLDLEEARRCWFAICCWRYRKEARSNPWTPDSKYFQETRELMLKFNNIIMAYAGNAALGSPHELRRTVAMISEFRFLVIAMMFSVRYDLHLSDQLRPSFINLIRPNEVSLTFHLPQRFLDMIPELDWEEDKTNDQFKVRLWPRVDVVKRSESAGIIRLTLGM